MTSKKRPTNTSPTPETQTIPAKNNNPGETPSQLPLPPSSQRTYQQACQAYPLTTSPVHRQTPSEIFEENRFNLSTLPTYLVQTNDLMPPVPEPPDKAYCRMTKKDFEVECLFAQDLALRAQVVLRNQAARSNHFKRWEGAMRRREEAMRSGEEAMRRREEVMGRREEAIRRREEKVMVGEGLVEWGWEQQEGVLTQACEMGIEIAGVVMEQRMVLERAMNPRSSRKSNNEDEDEDAQGGVKPSQG